MAEWARGRRRPAGPIRGFFRTAYDWVRQVLQEYNAERASLSAAAIAFYGTLSIFPLVLLAISGATYALGNQDEAVRRIGNVLGGVLVGDASATLIGVIQGVVRSRGIAGFVGLVGFVWAASRVFAIMVEAFDMAWDVAETRGFLKVNLLAVGLVFLSLLFGTLMFLGPLAVGLVLRYSDRLATTLGVRVDASGAWAVLVGLAAYSATIGLFYILYRYVPNRRVPWQSALIGAVTAGTLWEMVRYLFQIYLVNFASYNKVYGALAGAIILILWLYYSAMILMLGAITGAVHDARVFGDRPEHPEGDPFRERGRHAA